MLLVFHEVIDVVSYWAQTHSIELSFGDSSLLMSSLMTDIPVLEWLFDTYGVKSYLLDHKVSLIRASAPT